MMIEVHSASERRKNSCKREHTFHYNFDVKHIDQIASLHSLFSRHVYMSLLNMLQKCECFIS